LRPEVPFEGHHLVLRLSQVAVENVRGSVRVLCVLRTQCFLFKLRDENVKDAEPVSGRAR